MPDEAKAPHDGQPDLLEMTQQQLNTAMSAYMDSFEMVGQRVQIATSSGYCDGVTGKLIGVQQNPTVIVQDDSGERHHVASTILTSIALADADAETPDGQTVVSGDGEATTEYRAVGIWHTAHREMRDESTWWRTWEQVSQMAKDKRAAAQRGAYDRVVIEVRDVTYGPVRVWPEAQDVG